MPPYRFLKVDERGWPNCGSTGIKVCLKYKGGQAFPGHRAFVQSGSWCTISDRFNEANGCIEITLREYPFANSWGVYVVDGDSPRAEGDCGQVMSQIVAQLSEPVTVSTTDTNCCPTCAGSQWVHLTFQEK